MNGHPAPWTPELVGARLIAAFRLLPSTPIYSPARNLLLTLSGRETAPLDLIAATARYLGRTDIRRHRLLAWARAHAGGPAIRELCRELGWSRSTFHRSRRRALALVAAGLNRDGVSPAA